MVRIIIEIDGKKAKKAADAFMGWYLDGGGDDGFFTTCEDRGIEIEKSDWDIEKKVLKHTAV